CGHDGHTAVGLSFAEAMAGSDFDGCLTLIFQPAEEGGRGAAAMVAGGAVGDIDILYCFHFGLGLPPGSFAAGSTGWFATTKLRITIAGRPSHAAAAPESGSNALLAAATAALTIQAIPRFSTADTRINVGTLVAGAAPNI